MVSGHTKFKCDGSFGLIKKLYRNTTVDCIHHIVEIVKKSSSNSFNLKIPQKHITQLNGATPKITKPGIQYV